MPPAPVIGGSNSRDATLGALPPEPSPSGPPSAAHTALHVHLTGTVQGVGFRPYVHRLASEHHLTGWVRNGADGVTLEVEGPATAVRAFLERLPRETPPHSRIRHLETAWHPPGGHPSFVIRDSDPTPAHSGPVRIPPDLATCPDCLRDVFDPGNRRHRYPFTNCTQCGPRYSIVESLPYDRPRTSMRAFPLCPDCQAEYDDPRDRRFHAQPIACPRCGPQLEFWDPCGRTLAVRDQALTLTLESLRAGRIVALKGIGGFQLLVDATNHRAVQDLRERKRREAKPFAVMFPNLPTLLRHGDISPVETACLTGPEAPIVLVRRRPDRHDRSQPTTAPSVAPGSPWLGVMLPYSPLHHLLLAGFDGPLVATSGNPGDEPLCIDNHEALQRLAGIADAFLVHNRPIVRPVDDSVVRVVAGREMVLRRARGFVPTPTPIAPSPVLPPAAEPGSPGPNASSPPRPPARPATIALGGHQKAAIALSNGSEFILGQHLGDLDTVAALAGFDRCVGDLVRLFHLQPAGVCVDAHPDYASTRHGHRLGLPVRPVQHHQAHVLAVMTEHRLRPPLLGFAWDGTGAGLDGTVWGGETFHATIHGWRRCARLRPFRLPGAEAAIREPRRSALGLLYAAFGEDLTAQANLPTLRAFERRELALLLSALRRGLHAPWTSSVGRLFDAVASLAGWRHLHRFEGDAAMAVEFAAEGCPDDFGYPMPLQMPPPDRAAPDGANELDWEPLLQALLDDLRAGMAPGRIAARFHRGLADAIVAVARHMGERVVVLGGGCFQNRRLTESAVTALREAGFEPHWAHLIPPNDGGLALGQLAADTFPTEAGLALGQLAADTLPGEVGLALGQSADAFQPDPLAQPI
ncbi:MAG: carbamoyltransferase HypF [Verrucomicrobiae bacterium]|nr:carbamoyltransferase HypF [Verrucomicrobiae bacterium]